MFHSGSRKYYRQVAMKLLNFDQSLYTIFILLIASVKSCLYSSDLTELGKILLKNLGKTPFSDYEAIEDFKNSINFALKTSIVATPNAVKEIAILTQIYKNNLYILNATETIENYFNDVFSLLTPYNNYNVEDLQTVSKKYDISYVMKNSIAVYRGFFEKIMHTRKITKSLSAEPHELHCQNTLSIYQKVIGLQNRAILNLIMGFSTIIYFSKHYHVDQQDIKLSPDEMVKYITRMYDQYTTLSMKKLNRALEGVSRDIYRCDPQEHEHEKTYDRLYDFVEYYLTSERFLNENDLCDATLKHFDGVKHSSIIHKYIDESIRCHGTLYQCEAVDLKHLFLYGNDQIYQRYHAFSVANPQSPDDEILYGKIGDATFAYTKDDLNGVGENSPNYSDLNKNSTAVVNAKNCQIYGCFCDNHDSPRTVRYFSTKLMESAVEINRVIVGLRLKVKNRMVHIQIQTGKLIGLGVVNPKTVIWNEIQSVDINVEKNTSCAEYVELDYNKRSLYLDDVIAPKGAYLTGVKFSPAKDGVRIAAKFTPYDDFTLVTKQEFKILNRDDVDRTELELFNSSVPLYMIDLNSKPLSVQGRDYIKFQPSGIEDDAGQTTIPFLDTQSVETLPPSALGGFGIYLKGRPGFGGFIALKLISPEF